MREILFRGNRVDNGGWVEGGYWKNDTATRVYIKIIDTDGNPHTVDPATVCQYTGLTDVNGVKIWEGDICKDSLGWVFKVRWDNENARFLGHHDEPRGDVYICYIGRIPAVEVIGNIHDVLI